MKDMIEDRIVAWKVMVSFTYMSIEREDLSAPRSVHS